MFFISCAKHNIYGDPFCFPVSSQVSGLLSHRCENTLFAVCWDGSNHANVRPIWRVDYGAGHLPFPLAPVQFFEADFIFARGLLPIFVPIRYGDCRFVLLEDPTHCFGSEGTQGILVGARRVREHAFDKFSSSGELLTMV